MSFAGQIIRIPIGQTGLKSPGSFALLRITDLIQAWNLSYANDTMSKEGGATKYNSTAISGTPDIIGGFDWHPTAGTQRMIVATSAGTLLKDDGGGTFGTTLKSGLTVSDNAVLFVAGGKEAAANNRKLFIFTGFDPIQVLSGDGNTTSDISTPAADWTSAKPIGGLVHEGRLWAFGNSNDPHRLYYSTTGDHEDFTSTGSGSLSVFPGEGGGIKAAVSFKGLIVVFKEPAGVYFVDTTDPTISNWKVSRLSREIGIAGRRAWTLIDDDVLFVEPNGAVQLLSAVSEFGNLRTRSLSSSLELQNVIHTEFAPEPDAAQTAIFYPDAREVHITYKSIGSSIYNRRLVLDFHRSPPLVRISDRDEDIYSIWLREDSDGVPRLIYGGGDGFVWEMDQSTKSKDGAGYQGLLQTPHMDFSEVDPRFGIIRKAGRFLEIVASEEGNWNISADIYWDGALHETVQFNMGGDTATLGSFVLGTDQLASEGAVNRKKRITGSGRRLSIVLRNSGAGEDFSVSELYLHLVPSNERL